MQINMHINTNKKAVLVIRLAAIWYVFVRLPICLIELAGFVWPFFGIKRNWHEPSGYFFFGSFF